MLNRIFFKVTITLANLSRLDSVYKFHDGLINVVDLPLRSTYSVRPLVRRLKPISYGRNNVIVMIILLCVLGYLLVINDLE